MNSGEVANWSPKADCIAARANSQIGTAFKLHGRTAGEALDCVGLVGFAIAPFCAGAKLPAHYQMRGEFTDKVTNFLGDAPFAHLPGHASWQSGDIILAQAGPRQQHLLIGKDCGFIHAHAGLRRVVWTPAPLPWPHLLRWRIKEF
jgi:hypothetical protein